MKQFINMTPHTNTQLFTGNTTTTTTSISLNNSVGAHGYYDRAAPAPPQTNKFQSVSSRKVTFLRRHQMEASRSKNTAGFQRTSNIQKPQLGVYQQFSDWNDVLSNGLFTYRYTTFPAGFLFDLEIAQTCKRNSVSDANSRVQIYTAGNRNIT